MVAFFLVGTLGLLPANESQMAHAENSPKSIKENLLLELKSLELDEKKDQKNLNTAISELEKSLHEKFWQDDFYLSMIGKKVFQFDAKVIDKLSEIKSYDFSSSIASVLESDRQLTQNQIDLLGTGAGVKNLEKKLEKINKELVKAEEDVDKDRFENAIKHFKKAWKMAKMGEDVDVPESGSADFSNDGIPDYYVQLEETGKKNKPVVLTYKIQNECVDLGPKDPKDIGGDTYDDASMKIGISDVNREWLVSDMKVWNNWFKENDENEMVDLVYHDEHVLPKYSFLDGDDVIRESSKGSSFEQVESISQIGGQSGWEGSLFFTAPSGDYIFWTVHPAGGIDGCDRLAALGIHVVIP